MGRLTDSEIRKIIQKASLLQKFEQAGASFKLPETSDEISPIFEISDELNIPRKHVYEAYLEHTGIPVSEPFLIDTMDRDSAKAIGFAHGTIDKSLLNELKRQAEYHFNTMGNISHRRNKIIWKAKPSGVSRLFASASSPEVEFEEQDGNTKISVSQSLKTQNKWYLPGVLTGFSGLMLLMAVIFERIGNEVAPPLIISALIIAASLYYLRFVKQKANKKKKNLLELTETLQGKIERHFRATSLENKDQQKGDIEIPETDETLDEIEVGNASKSKIKE